jgi:hypothetical protein
MTKLRLAFLSFLMFSLGLMNGANLSLRAISSAEAAPKKVAKKIAGKSKKTKAASAAAPREEEPAAAPAKLDPEEAKQLREAYQLIRERKYEAASQRLYRLSRNPLLRDYREELRYKLGLVLMEMGLNQVAAVEFLRVAVKGKSKFLKQSLEKLSFAADALNFDVLLNLAISKITVGEFPAIHKDMLFYRIGEFQMKKKDYLEAAKNFSKVEPNSRYFFRAKYSQAVALAEDGKPGMAAQAFDEILSTIGNKDVTDPIRVSALIGRARALYQDKKWDEAIYNYREVPRDANAWHETLFEGSWAMLRGAKFRSALSNFQSLHSPYYEHNYLPESLVLRSIVYLYICKFDELNKTLGLFENVYGPVRKKILQYLSRRPDPTRIYQDFMAALDGEGTPQIPLPAVSKIEKEYDFSQNQTYLENLNSELETYQKLSPTWKNSPLGKYAQKLITLRIKKSEKKLGLIIKRHLFEIKSELRDFFEQVGFLQLEVVNLQKEEVKKELSKKDEEKAMEELGMGKAQVDQNADRKFYIQNGFEFWPFQGEYWLDELGNYHYLGVSSCQKKNR